MGVNQGRSEVIILQVLDCQLKSASPLSRNENLNWTRTSSPLQSLQAGYSSLQRRDAAKIAKSNAEIMNHCRAGAYPRAKSAVIPKSGPEIKNHCSARAKTRVNLAAIRKFGLEIKNRCTKEGLNRQKLASIPSKRLRGYVLL